MNETSETLSEWLLTQTGDMQIGFDHVDAWGVDRADRDALRERLKEAEKDIIYLAGEVSEGSEMVAEAAVMWAKYSASLSPEDPRKFGEALPSGIKPGHG